jgi:hypothetical protein
VILGKNQNTELAGHKSVINVTLQNVIVENFEFSSDTNHQSAFNDLESEQMEMNQRVKITFCIPQKQW